MARILLVHHAGRAGAELRARLSDAGHEAAWVEDAASALAAFSARPPDIVVLTDASPPTFELFGALKAADPAARIVVFKSGADPAARGGAPARFGIPALRPEQLPAAVAALLGGGRAWSADGRFQPRLVLADDDPAVRNVLRRFAQGAGYAVHAAADGKEAVALCESARPHLVLLDVDMPVMSGLEALRRIRARDGRTGVMMITGNDAVETMIQCRDLGAYDYLLKPFDFRYLGFSLSAKLVDRLL